jgi:hypothetical protein
MAYNIGQASAFTPPSKMDWNNPQGGLGQDIMDYLKNNQVPSTVPQGQKWAGMPQIGINGGGMYVLPGGDASFGTPGYGVVSGGQGGEYWYKPLNGNEKNAANYVYNPDGSFNRVSRNTSIMSPAMGVASVLGAGLGMGALFGGLGGAGGLLGGGGSLAGSGAGFVGEGALSGIPAWDGALAGASPGFGGAVGAAGAGLGGGGGGGALTGVPPPANPFTASTGGLFSGGGLGNVGSTLGKLGMSALGGGGGGGGSSGGSMLGNFGNLGVNDVLGALGGGLDWYNQSQAADKMLNWLNGNQSKMEGFMNPGNPEYNAMWDQMSRSDAAAGRNSQYGPRTSDFLAKVAQAKANNIMNFTTGTSRAYSNALNQNASAPTGFLQALQRTGKGLGNPSLSQLFSGLGGLPGSAPSGLSGIPEWDQAWQSALGNSGNASDFIDYGQYI